jgi:hypothetical protein
MSLHISLMDTAVAQQPSDEFEKMLGFETVTTNVKLPVLNSLQFCGSSRLVSDGRYTFPVSIDEDDQGQSFRGNLELCLVRPAYERMANCVKSVKENHQR